MKLLFSLVISQLTGALGALFTVSSVSSWYPTLNKPPFTPPNWLFGPAWTLLYILMGISFYLVWRQKINKKIKTALAIFVIQLILNLFWSMIFFGFKNPSFALLEIVVLWFFILLTIVKFLPLSKKAAYLLIPYLLWVTFATILNFSIVRLN